MTKPLPTRKEGIIQKLDFAEVERNALQHALFGTYASDTPLPQFVAQRAETVLSNTRECFDHLGLDLFEQLLLPHASAKLQKQHTDSRVKFYFPFFRGQLEQKQFGLHEFKAINRTLYDELVRFVDGMDQKVELPRTSFRTDHFRVIQQMVNEKKHSRVLQYEVKSEGARFAAGVLPDGGAVQAVVSTPNPGKKVDVWVPNGGPSKAVPTFRFLNGHDVNELCLFAVHATRIVMDVFYDQFFEPTARSVNSESPVPFPTAGVTPHRASFKVVFAGS